MPNFSSPRGKSERGINTIKSDDIPVGASRQVGDTAGVGAMPLREFVMKGGCKGHGEFRRLSESENEGERDGKEEEEDSEKGARVGVREV